MTHTLTRARTSLALRYLSATMLLSTTIASAQVQQQLDRSKRPIVAPVTTFAFPSVATRDLPNGITVAVIQNDELPVVAVRAVIEGGALLDPPGKEGLYAMLNGMLREGTATKTADQLAEAFADLGNSVNPGGFTTITRNLDESLALLADMLMHPSFPQDALDRQKANTIANIQRLKEQPGFVAQQIFNTVAYGADHPYQRSATEQSISSITRDDLVRFHDTYLRPQNVKIVVAGAVTPATAVSRVQRAFGGWAQQGAKVSYDVPAAKGPGKTTIYLYDRPNSPQSVVFVGQLGPSRGSDDFYALDVMNTIYGQLSGSRLNQNLRERHAFTYGANTFWIWRRAPEVATFVGQSSVVAPKTDSALVEWMSELRGIRGERPVTAKEMDYARTNRVAGLPASLESMDQVANAVAQLLRDNLPLDYHAQYVRRVSSISSDQIAAAAAKYIDPDNSAIVIVGDRKVIEPGLRAANIAPIVFVDETGKPIP